VFFEGFLAGKEFPTALYFTLKGHLNLIDFIKSVE
jgi:hypothetical protein